MTLATQINRADHVGDASTTVFAYQFRVDSLSHMKVYLDDVLQTSGYTVQDLGEDAGGTVTFSSAPGSSVAVSLIRIVPYTQAVDYDAYDRFPEEVHEGALDTIVMQVQQLDEANDRTVTVPVSETNQMVLPYKDDRAEKLLGFDSDGDPTVSASTVAEMDAVVAAGINSIAGISYVKYLSAYTSFAAAVAAIGSIPTTLVMDTTSILTANLTIPSTLTLNWLQGCIVTGAYTLTVNSMIQASDYQLFGTNVTVLGLACSYPDWWGVDGSADDVEIEKAIAATAGGQINFNPLRVYDIDAGLTLSDNGTSFFCPTRKAGLITSSADIYMLTIDDCRYARLTNIGFSNSHGSPTKANILLAGKAKDGEFFSVYSSGNKYGILFDGAQGSAPGGCFYNNFQNLTVDASTDECIYYTDYAGHNENWFYAGRLADSTGQNKFIRVTGNGNKFIGMAIESANSADNTTFTVTDNGISNVFAFNRFETDNCGILVDSTLTDEAQGTVIIGNYWSNSRTVRVVVKDGIAQTDTAGQDMTFRGMVKGVSTTTTVDVSSASGQKVISVTATTSFYEGQPIVIDYGNTNEEWHLIDSIQSGISLTFVGDLTYTHAIGVNIDGNNGLMGMQTWNQDDVSKMRFWAGRTLVMELDGDPAAGQNRTSLLLYDHDSDDSYQVYIGAADSGGSGFRMLRIAN